MADSYNSDSSPSGNGSGSASPGSDAGRPADWYEQQWSALCDVLGTSDPEEVVPRVRTLKDQLDDLDSGSRSPEGLVTISEVEEVFQEMHEKLQKLRERNAALVDQLEDDDGSGVQSAFKELHQEAESLLESLGASNMDEARDRIRSLNQQLDNLYREKERLVEAGLTSADEALEEINRLQSERDEVSDELETTRERAESLEEKVDRLQQENESLQEEKDELRRRADELETRAEAAEFDAQSSTAAAASERVSELEEANEALKRQNDELEARNEDLVATNDELTTTNDELRSDNEDLQAKVDELEHESSQLHEQNQHLQQATQDLKQQTADLQEEAETLREENDELEQRVDELRERSESMREERDRLQSERDRFQAERNQLESKVSQLESKVAQLREQAESESASQSASPDTSVLEAASAVKSIMGVTSPDEARALAEAVENMYDRLQRASRQRDRITTEAGVDDPDDVLTMIRSMEEQLVDVYENREASGQEASPAGPASPQGSPSESSSAEPSEVDAEIGRALGVSSVEEAQELEQLVHDMTDRLERLSHEHQKLEEAGLTVDRALAMIENMEDQLVDLYGDRDEQGDGSAASEPASASQLGSGAGTEDAAESETRSDPSSDIFSSDTLFGRASEDGPDAASSDGDSGPSGFFEDAAMPGGAEDASLPSDQDEREELLNTIRRELGVTSPDEVGELSQLVRSMTTQLNHLSEQQSKLADLGLSFESALTMIQNMEEQLVDLYEEREQVETSTVRERLESLQAILGIDTPEEARELEAMVRALEERLSELLTEKRDLLNRVGVASVDNVSAMVASMEDQLVDLYEEREQYADAQQALSDIEDVLGISSRSEAQELAGIARNMEEQLDDLYEDKQKLEAVGLDSVEDAVNMITSMEDQLVELYEDKESVQDVGTMSMGPEQDTFQQLESLYAEQEKLKRELGVADADEIIEMVEGLSTQLDELYADRDANLADDLADDVDALLPGERDTESLSAPGAASDSAGESASDRSPDASSDRSPDPDVMIASMRQQLEALYEEKDVLLENGMGDAREAISHIESLRKQIRSLNEQNNEYEQRFDRLKNELGTSSITQVIRTVRNLRSQSQRPSKDAAARDPDRSAGASSASGGGDGSGGSSESGNSADTESDGLVIDAAPGFVDDQTLAGLEDMNTDELDDLDFGAIRLSDDGEIRYVNEAGLSLPGLKSADDRTTIRDKNFFLEIAPSTNNNLFFGRFKQGIKQGAMDARFPYTFISPGKGPTVLIVHLHRKRDRGVNWLLFRPM